MGSRSEAAWTCNPKSVVGAPVSFLASQPVVPSVVETGPNIVYHLLSHLPDIEPITEWRSLLLYLSRL